VNGERAVALDASLHTRGHLALYWHVLSLELRKVFAYRTDFWIRFLGSLGASIAIAYYLWSTIFADTGLDRIEGYTFPMLMLYYVLVPLVAGITQSAVPGAISDEIYGGTLTRYLIYPVPFFPLKLMGSLAGMAIALVQLLMVLACYAVFVGFPAEAPLTPLTVLAGLAAAGAASIVYFLLATAVEMVAFWADHIWSLNVMLMFCVRLLGGAMLPLALFPTWAAQALRYTPFPYVVAFPIETMMGRTTSADWLQAVAVLAVWGVLLLGLDRLLWRWGSREYTGVGQ
jgi:ABC-2 type transport system permease protein